MASNCCLSFSTHRDTISERNSLFLCRGLYGTIEYRRVGRLSFASGTDEPSRNRRIALSPSDMNFFALARFPLSFSSSSFFLFRFSVFTFFAVRFILSESLKVLIPVHPLLFRAERIARRKSSYFRVRG